MNKIRLALQTFFKMFIFCWGGLVSVGFAFLLLAGAPIHNWDRVLFGVVVGGFIGFQEIVFGLLFGAILFLMAFLEFLSYRSECLG